MRPSVSKCILEHTVLASDAGAFTSGQSLAEVQGKLQVVLETTIGLILRAGEELPKSRFHQVSQLDMSEAELARNPVSDLLTFSLDLHLMGSGI